MLRKKLNLCEHRWVFWGRIAVGGLVGDAYTCAKCPTTEILVKFGSRDEMETALEGRAMPPELKEGNEAADLLAMKGCGKSKDAV